MFEEYEKEVKELSNFELFDEYNYLNDHLSIDSLEEEIIKFGIVSDEVLIRMGETKESIKEYYQEEK